VQAARDCLAADSAIGRALPGFRPRPEQLDMADAVEEAMADGRNLVVEAGTGVGKSFAYLVPALLAAAEGAGKVVVATRTIALQEQIVERDIPFLREALDAGGVKVALAKGRGNYVCRRRLELAHGEPAGFWPDPDRAAQVARILDWAEESDDGSLADLPFAPAPEVWEAVRAESGNCLHQRCPFFAGCAYQRSRRELYGADIVIANHALVFSDLALRERGASILPDYETLILDEAHEIEDGAAEHFGARVSALGILQQLGRFMGRRRTGLFARAEVRRELPELLGAARDAVHGFFEGVTRWRGEAGERRFREAGPFPDPVTKPLGALVHALRERHETIEDPSLAIEWRARTNRLEESRDAIALVQGAVDSGLVYWVERAGRGDRSVLRAAPREVASLLRRTLFARVRTVVMTSATLRVADSFDHFARRVGLDEPATLGLGSPFDFKRQCKLVLYPRLPDPRDPRWEDETIVRIRALVLESGGGAFVLFTSHRALTRAHAALREELEAAGLFVLRQGDGLRTREIVQAFRERENCVLFATDTFWQGVDVRGHSLRLVVLTKLPFAVPDHPLQQARVEHIEDMGGDSFRELSLPQAVLKLRQGFGRLIRSHEDTGTVAILDPRIRTKRYGAVFLQSLPECEVEERP
jgi:ATP-dependent DNA helicase DinG